MNRLLRCILIGQPDQSDEAAIRDLAAAEEYHVRMQAVASVLSPALDVEGRLRGHLALEALLVATTQGERIGGSPDERAQAALAAAFLLTR